MNIIVLNSGSNGNAIYVESESGGSAILLDCGISRRQIEARLKVHGRYPTSIRGVFISHEHGDHIRGLVSFSKSYRCPIYLTEPTFRNMWRREQVKGFRFMRYSDSSQVGDITVEAFPKSHDAADPVYFLVTSGGKRLLYVTDLGTPDAALEHMLSTVDAVFLESNYDSHMLWSGDYPDYLKARIDATHGHLSNAQAMDLLERCCKDSLQMLILGHLSENNNTPEIVKSEIVALFERRDHFRPHVVIASRYDVSDVITV